MDSGKQQPESKKHEKKEKTSRRQFLAGSSGAVLAGALSGCRSAMKPAATAASANRVPGANDRIRVGVIGTGGMGTAQILDIVGRQEARSPAASKGLAPACNVEITAVCDVYDPWRERAESLTGARGFVDHQDLLGSGLVDCVYIVTPEHWHHRMALDALAAGMDVYLQKPMTRTHEQALELRNAFSRSDRIFQLGSQYLQKPSWYRARELQESGQLGRVVLSQTSYHRNSRGGEWNYDIEDARPGVNLDWKRWLGPLGHVDYSPEYFFRWRKYSMFSGGIITDLLPHKIHSLCYVLGTRLPRDVTCVGGIYVHPDRTVADTVVMTVDYGDELMMVSGATCNEHGLEDMIRGHEATLHIGDNAVQLTPERPFADELDPIQEKLEPAEMSSNMIHMKEFFDCMRTRKKPTWDVESTYHVMTAIAMAEQAYLEKRTVHFDPRRQRVS